MGRPRWPFGGEDAGVPGRQPGSGAGTAARVEHRRRGRGPAGPPRGRLRACDHPAAAAGGSVLAHAPPDGGGSRSRGIVPGASAAAIDVPDPGPIARRAHGRVERQPGRRRAAVGRAHRAWGSTSPCEGPCWTTRPALRWPASAWAPSPAASRCLWAHTAERDHGRDGRLSDPRGPPREDHPVDAGDSGSRLPARDRVRRRRCHRGSPRRRPRAADTRQHDGPCRNRTARYDRHRLRAPGGPGDPDPDPTGHPRRAGRSTSWGSPGGHRRQTRRRAGPHGPQLPGRRQARQPRSCCWCRRAMRSPGP